MIKVEMLREYSPEFGEEVRELLKQLSRSGKDKGEIPAEVFLDIIDSPWAEMFCAFEEDEESGEAGSGAESAGLNSGAAGRRLVGMGTVAMTMGPAARKMLYLEDFVTDASVRGPAPTAFSAALPAVTPILPQAPRSASSSPR